MRVVPDRRTKNGTSAPKIRLVGLPPARGSNISMGGAFFHIRVSRMRCPSLTFKFHFPERGSFVFAAILPKNNFNVINKPVI